MPATLNYPDFDDDENKPWFLSILSDFIVAHKMRCIRAELGESWPVVVLVSNRPRDRMIAQSEREEVEKAFPTIPNGAYLPFVPGRAR